MSAASLAGIAAAAAVLAIAAALWPRPHPLAAPVVPSPSAAAADRPGHRAARRRAQQVDREVPQLLDLLAAGSTAGLSAELSLRRAAEVLHGPLGDDLRAIAGTADLGARWRDELTAYAERSSTDLRRSVAVLERTEALGSSLADATRELATSVRQARRTAILEEARTAPIKMLFPLVFLILPAFLLLTVVPVLLTTVRSIG
ncbi:MAG TPA: type II secretion system F family protein [Actinomycetota bacterium]|nr:type II secretion system F family protein [Actinomycetota bacterium]